MSATIELSAAEVPTDDELKEVIRWIRREEPQPDGKAGYVIGVAFAVLPEVLRLRARVTELEIVGKKLTEEHSIVDAGCDPPACFDYDEAWFRFWQVVYRQTEEEAKEAEFTRQEAAHARAKMLP